MAFKAFLKIDGIDGPSPDGSHSNWIELLGFSHGLAQQGSFGKDGQLTGGAVDVHEITVNKELDIASPLINEKCCTGAAIKEVIIELTAATGDKHTFMKYTFSPCVIASVVISGGAGGSDKPSENVSFRFNTVKWEFTPYNGQTPGDAIRSGWDIGKGDKAS